MITFKQFIAEAEETYYHGTARKDLKFLGLGSHWRGGIYFTPKYSEAVQHAKMDSEVEGGKPHVIHARLKFFNAKKMSGIESHELTVGEVRALQKQGYDALINGAEIAVFDTDQIDVTKIEAL